MSGCKSDYDRRDKAAAQMPNTFEGFAPLKAVEGPKKKKSLFK
jgi:hypothetical protein